MNEQDYGLVVGIRRYPGMPPELEGAENDARAFHQWLVSEKGGGLLESHTQLLLASGTTCEDACPTDKQIENWLTPLYLRAKRKGRGGRRLYLFFAGHGFSPGRHEAAIYMADASEDLPGRHVPGKAYADFFLLSVFFEEVVLFMDCCRRDGLMVGLRGVPWPEQRVETAEELTKHFYAFGTYWGGVSLERMMGSRKHGLFTSTLLEGLEGKAANNKGEITSRSLQDYLERKVPLLCQGNERQEPRFDASPRPIVFGRVAVPDFPVRVLSTAPGQLILRKGELAEVLTGDPRVKTPEGWSTRLPRGLYEAELGTETKFFRVEGETDVRL
ncbi:MAG TPA: caspase family protein [Archangium sp.]|nr:caspase family protein [Archangium sp.]